MSYFTVKLYYKALPEKCIGPFPCTDVQWIEDALEEAFSNKTITSSDKYIGFSIDFSDTDIIGYSITDRYAYCQIS
jgi:hypothetical protein